jgi:arylsulfatase A-like enzyme
VYLGMTAVVRDRGFDVLEDAGDIGGNHESSFGVDEPATVDRMLAWVDSLDDDDRFFLTYLPIAGHHPYATSGPGSFPDVDDWGRYRNAIREGDTSLGVLIDGLRARGLHDETLWIVYGDHGQAFGQHDGNYGHTFFLYEENVRVPFVVAAPGAIETTMRSRTTVSLVDTAPTLLDVLGLPIPDVYQGRSALEGEPRMALFFTDYSLSLVGLRDGRWKFVHDLASGRSKLFDLERDPEESADISLDHPVRVAAYVRRVWDWSAAQKARMQ